MVKLLQINISEEHCCVFGEFQELELSFFSPLSVYGLQKTEFGLHCKCVL